MNIPTVVIDQLKRIEKKLDQLIAALADEQGEEQPESSLDGAVVPRERDQTMGLD